MVVKRIAMLVHFATQNSNKELNPLSALLNKKEEDYYLMDVDTKLQNTQKAISLAQLLLITLQQI